MSRILMVAGCLVLGSFALNSVVSLPASGQEPNPRSEPQLREGVVVSAGGGQLSIRAADGKEHAFKTNEMTKITVNGKPGKLEDLKAGVQVRVMVDAKGMVASISTVDDRKRI
jgi:hypothetical protein